LACYVEPQQAASLLCLLATNTNTLIRTPLTGPLPSTSGAPPDVRPYRLELESGYTCVERRGPPPIRTDAPGHPDLETSYLCTIGGASPYGYADYVATFSTPTDPKAGIDKSAEQWTVRAAGFHESSPTTGSEVQKVTKAYVVK